MCGSLEDDQMCFIPSHSHEEQSNIHGQVTSLFWATPVRAKSGPLFEANSGTRQQILIPVACRGVRGPSGKVEGIGLAEMPGSN